MGYHFSLSASWTEPKRVALEQITHFLYQAQPNPKTLRALSFSGLAAVEIDKWRKYGQKDKNLILVDEHDWVLKSAVDRAKIKGAILFPYPLTRANIRKYLSKNESVDVLHIDTLATLDGQKSETSMRRILEAISTPGFLAPNARIAFTFIRAHDKRAKKQADKLYNGDRISVLHARLCKSLNRKVVRISSGEYKNGSRGTFPMAWVVFGLKKGA